MVKEKTITKFIRHLKQALAANISLNQYQKEHSLSNNYFCVTFKKIRENYKDGRVDKKYMDQIQDLYSKVSNRRSKSIDLISDEEADDDRNSIEFERDEKNKIKCYKFKILRRDKEPLVGNLTRDEANTIHRLYTYYGMSITQREVSRYFPEWSLQDFKRVLRVFNITKASAPFAPHVIEEHTTDELLAMQMREKENDFLRKLEAERIKSNERLLTKYANENAELKREIQDCKEIVKSIKIDNTIELHYSEFSAKQSIIIWLSDIHTGAAVSAQSIYSNNYDEKELNRRLDLIVTTINNLAALYSNFHEIIVCNLGDSLDGMDAQTVRRDHLLPQNMNNKEQVQVFIKSMVAFFTHIAECTNKLSYYCVGESNHDGDLGWLANLALGEILKTMEVDVHISDKFISHFTVYDKTYILCHGKDNKDMFKNLPLVLNEKTENYINEYIDNQSLTGKITFVKGDLHQSACTYARRFTYKSVGSIFGSSEWIHKNFGNTKACCDYSIINNCDRDLYDVDGRIVLQ